MAARVFLVEVWEPTTADALVARLAGGAAYTIVPVPEDSALLAILRTLIRLAEEDAT